MLSLTDLIAQRLRVGSHIKAPCCCPGRKIHGLCSRVAKDVCHVDLIHYAHGSRCFKGLGTTSFHPESMELAKAQSLFCLEPLGDSPYRKSIWDSLSLGCIPVVFSVYSEITAPWHWGGWRNTSRVYVPEKVFLDDDFDLVDYLRAIPPGHVRSMQDTIAKHANAINIAVDDLPYDAYETLVRRVVLETTKYEARPRRPFKGDEHGQWLDVGRW